MNNQDHDKNNQSNSSPNKYTSIQKNQHQGNPARQRLVNLFQGDTGGQIQIDSNRQGQQTLLKPNQDDPTRKAQNSPDRQFGEQNQPRETVLSGEVAKDDSNLTLNPTYGNSAFDGA